MKPVTELGTVIEDNQNNFDSEDSDEENEHALEIE